MKHKLIKTEMENKYYKPAIQEFNIGFRYQSCIPYRRTRDEKWTEDWVKHEYSLLDFEWTIHTILTQLQFDNAIRVKYLDESDIIDAGWNENENQSPSYCTDYLLGDEWSLDIFDSERGIRIMQFDEIKFFGKIKNYNELLKVMEMLNIIPYKNVKS